MAGNTEAGRAYGQYCLLARALDVLGQRWTLLIVRELLLGPKRYSDLLRALPGIGTNRLASRLKELERHAVVRRDALLPPAASAVYALTERGRELEPAVVALARLGRHFMGPRAAGQALRPAWVGLAMKLRFRPEAAAGVDDEYEFRVGGERFAVRVAARMAEVRDGPGHRPAAVLTTDVDTLIAIGSGQCSLGTALRAGAVALDGDPLAAARYDRVFGYGTGEAAR